MWTSLLAIFVLSAFCQAANLTLQKDNEYCNENRNITIPWITKIVSFSMQEFKPEGADENSLCTHQGKIYWENVKNLTLWATQMLDASSIGPSGLLSGNNFHFGNFEQCISINVPQYNISGRYVMASIEFSPYSDSDPWSGYEISEVYKEPGLNSSVWEALKPTTDPRIKKRNVFNWALCVPNSCQDQDIEEKLRNRLEPALKSNGIQGKINILSKYTYARQETEISRGFLIFVFVNLVLVALLVCGTFYEVFIFTADADLKKSKTDEIPWLTSFSVRKNIQHLFKVENQEFASISGMKTISMFLIIFGHRNMMSNGSPLINSKSNELVIGQLLATYVQNGILVVNSFLVFTGFLTYNKFLNDIDKNKKINIIKSLYHRWIRLTPTYAYVMAFSYYILSNVEGGPLSRSTLWDYKQCENAWWTHLLYVNNYVTPQDQCLVPAWYLALDMQLYVLCTLMSYILWRSRKVGLIILFLATIVSIVIPGISILWNRYKGITLIYMSGLSWYFTDVEFVNIYLPSHIRASPYLIAMVAAYIYYKMKMKKITLNSSTIWMLTILSFISFNLAYLGAWIFYIPGRTYYLQEHVLYSILHRIGWSLPICWAIISHALVQFGPVKYTVGFRFFAPFNRLTYCALLVHTPIQLYMAGTIHAPFYYSRILSIWMACGDVCFSYFFAIILHLAVESPFSSLQNCNFKSLWKKK